jgi:hypothetical protein
VRFIAGPKRADRQADHHLAGAVQPGQVQRHRRADHNGRAGPRRAAQLVGVFLDFDR